MRANGNSHLTADNCDGLDYTKPGCCVVSLALMALGVWWLMPSSWPRSRAGGWLLTLVGGGLLASRAARGDGAARGVDPVLDFRARRRCCAPC